MAPQFPSAPLPAGALHPTMADIILWTEEARRRGINIAPVGA